MTITAAHRCDTDTLAGSKPESNLKPRQLRHPGIIGHSTVTSSFKLELNRVAFKFTFLLKFYYGKLEAFLQFGLLKISCTQPSSLQVGL